MSTATLFMTDKNWEQFKRPSAGRRRNCSTRWNGAVVSLKRNGLCDAYKNLSVTENRWVVEEG